MATRLLFGFLGVVFFYGFFHSLHLKTMQKTIDETQLKLDELHLKVASLRKKNARSKNLIDSKEDPATIELMLMQNLGLVPKGAKKVYFKG